MIDIVSIGQAAAWTKSSVTWIRRAAQELRIVPSFRINGIDHYDTSDLELIRARIEQRRSAGGREPG